MIPLDALERDWVKRIIYRFEPNIVIYSAGREDVEWAEKNPRDADRIHAGGSVMVSTVADILKPKFILLSNAYVFDGERGNYHENDTVVPATSLGKAKVSAENFIRSRSLNYTIVRSAPLLGRGNPTHPSFLDKLRIRLAQGEKLDVPMWETHSFALIDGFVDLIEQLIEGGPKNSILHYSGLTRVTHYELAVKFAERFGLDPKLIHPQHLQQGSTIINKSIFDYSLNCTQASSLLKIKPLLLEEAFDLFDERLVRGLGTARVPR